MHKLVCIVEGKGDQAALPVLLQRLLREEYRRTDWQVLVPKPAGSCTGLTRTGGIENLVALASADPGCNAVLVLIDADAVHHVERRHRSANPCTPDFARLLAARVRAMDLRLPVGIVAPHWMYEAWLIGSIETTAVTLPGRRTGLRCPPNVEELPDPQAWLDAHLPRDDRYVEVRDQQAMTERLDFSLAARRCRSFRRLHHALA